jgi:hypothetical protein
MLQEKTVAHARALPLNWNRDMAFAVEKKVGLLRDEMSASEHGPG